MTNSKVIISPKTKVGELLDAYPELENVLMAMSPAFEKLKNPVLRKTVAKVATLQQVSVVGGVNIDEMIRILRKNAGQNEMESLIEDQVIKVSELPEWFDKAKIKEKFDATSIINAGESPMKEILQRVSLLKPGDIFELTSPFTPAPIIDMLHAKKYKTCTIVDNLNVLTYICKEYSTS
jgi:hypothetical protein